MITNRSWLIRLTVLLLGLSAPLPASIPTTVSAEEKIGPISLQDVPLNSVLELLEQWTGRALLKPQSLPVASLSLNLPEEVTRAEALQALETLLSLNGVALAPLGDKFLKVTPLNSARSEAPELIAGSTLDLPPSGRTVVKLFRPRFLRVSEFSPQISGLLNSGAGGQPVIFEKANAVLVTDSLSNLQRIETLLNELDQPSDGILQPKFYNLRHAKASELVGKLKAMLTGTPQNQLGTSTSYSADDRTNQMVLFAEPEHHAMFDELVARLDTSSGHDTQSEVLQLKHATAKDVAALLGQMASQQASSARNLGQETIWPAKATPVEGSPEAGSASDAPSLQSQFSPLLTILAEERSNALIVSGTVNDLRLIKAMVAQVDVLLAQVRIEVVIAEVTLSNNSATGISELGLRVEGDKLTGFSASLPGLTVKEGSVTRPSEETPTSGVRDLAAQITLAATPRKSHANILSVPNIITTHNREGRIFVGEERPVISSYLNDGGLGSSSGAGAGYRSTVDSKDIGIQLSVKPLIGADGSVQLEIKQEVNDILGEITIDGNPQPRIGRRSTESFVSVRSGEIIVLGGLQRTSTSRSTTRFGPIPIIGDLLGARNREKSRTDLLFFLRPTVLTNTDQDNTAALDRVRALPKAQREEILRSIDPPAGK